MCDKKNPPIELNNEQVVNAHFVYLCDAGTLPLISKNHFQRIVEMGDAAVQALMEILDGGHLNATIWAKALLNKLEPASIGNRCIEDDLMDGYEERDDWSNAIAIRAIYLSASKEDRFNFLKHLVAGKYGLEMYVASLMEFARIDSGFTENFLVAYILAKHCDDQIAATEEAIKLLSINAVRELSSRAINVLHDVSIDSENLTIRRLASQFLRESGK